MQVKNLPGIYTITCVPTGKRYVGSTCSIRGRIKDHINGLRKGIHGNGYLQCAYNKYGELQFRFDTLMYCNIDNLLLFEQRAMDVLKPEFNLAPLAGSTRGTRLSDKARENISRAHADVRGEKNANFGKRHIFDDKARKNMSISHLGITHGPMTLEQRQKMSIAAKKRFENPKERERLRLANLGKKASLETRTKMSISRKKRHAGK